VILESIAAKSQIAVSNTTTTTVLPNGTIVQNATVSLPIDLHSCPDNDFDGRCSIETGNVVNRCLDEDRNNICELYEATDGVVYPEGEGPFTYGVVELSGNKTLVYDHVRDKNMLVPVEFADRYEPAIQNVTKTNTTADPVPAPMTQIVNLVCQSNDDFCEPGCEHVDMQCINEENDDNKDGVRDSEEQGSNDNSRNDDDDKPYCDQANLDERGLREDCFDRRDYSELDFILVRMDNKLEITEIVQTVKAIMITYLTVMM